MAVRGGQALTKKYGRTIVMIAMRIFAASESGTTRDARAPKRREAKDPWETTSSGVPAT